MTTTPPTPSRLPRGAGVMLHPTSLPGRFGIGDLGPGTIEFLDLLAGAGQRWWQILPLVPAGFGHSPYQSYSSFAGNPLLISPEAMAEAGWLARSDWAGLPAFPDDHVDFEAVTAAKERLLRRAFASFRPEPPEFRAFVEENAGWLDDYALYMALKRFDPGTAWFDWEPGLAHRDPRSLAQWREKLADSVRYVQFVQYAFAVQWRAVREACRERGLSVFGDLPIFVAWDSADVWSRPDLFCLDECGRPTVAAGVPPDAFAPETGQLWGNPLYHWPAHAAEGYAWWIGRIRAQLGRVDLLRLDHFRGLEAYWEIPAGAASAAAGRWVEGPGALLLEAVREAVGGLPLVAEDLGVITESVVALRDRFHLPGMRVLQFALEATPGTEFHLPYRYVRHCVAYTGTHDNDTTVGWFTRALEGTPAKRAYHQAQRAYARKLLGSSGDDVHWGAIRAVFDSVADTVIVPMQDVLGLGDAARMNVPGKAEGNWAWRYADAQLGPRTLDRLAELTALSGRWNGTVPDRFAPPSPPCARDDREDRPVLSEMAAAAGPLERSE